MKRQPTIMTDFRLAPPFWHVVHPKNIILLIMHAFSDKNFFLNCNGEIGCSKKW
jgi:hypothetical protein